MKHLSVILSILCLAGSAAAQSQQQPDSLPQGPGWHVVYRDTTLGFVSISFPTPDTGFVLGQDPITLRKVTLRTTDSGNTWSELATSPNGNRVLFLTSNIGYILAGRTVHKTTNGGLSWTPHGIGTQGFQNSMVFPTKDTGFIAGAGDVTRTTDAGETWQAYGNSLGACDVISFSDHLNGFFGGGVGTSPADSGREHAANFARTTDGGTTWIPTYSHLGRQIYSIHAINEHTLLVGTGGFIARSTDVGWSWDTTVFTTDEIAAFSFSDTLHGLAVGGGGIIFYTGDGGKHWINQSILTPGYTNDAQLLPNVTAFVISDAGSIVTNQNVEKMDVSISTLSTLNIQVFPNPGNAQIRFQYLLPQPDRVTFQVFGSDGVLISTLAQSEVEVGSQTLSVSTDTLVSGPYFYQLTSEHYHSSGSFTLIK